MKPFLNQQTMLSALRRPVRASRKVLQAGVAVWGCAFAALVLAVPLGAQSPAPAPAVAAQPRPPADKRPETVISSDELDMVGGDEANHFYFRGNVKVQATNMLATCDELEVISARQGGKSDADEGSKGASATGSAEGDGAEGSKAEAVDPKNDTSLSRQRAAAGNATEKPDARDAAAPNIGSIREIIMRGNVVISQEGRRATAGVAYLYPQEGRVVLADNPLVTDEQGTLSGWRMELYRGERRVRILSNPDEKQRTRVTLPALQDLGYGEMGAGAGAADTASGTDTQGGAATEGATDGQSGAGAKGTTGSLNGAAASDAAKPDGGAVGTDTEGSTATADSTTTSATSGQSTTPAATEETPDTSKRSGGWRPVRR